MSQKPDDPADSTSDVPNADATPPSDAAGAPASPPAPEAAPAAEPAPAPEAPAPGAAAAPGAAPAEPPAPVEPPAPPVAPAAAAMAPGADIPAAAPGAAEAGGGAVPPVPPVAAAGGGTGDGGAGGGSGKKSRVGLFVGLGVGALVLVAAIIAVVVLVLPMLFGGARADTALVRDYPQELAEGWTFDIVGDHDEDYVESTPGWTPVGDDRALIWATFDESSFRDDQGDSYGWYENYDDHYDLGYDAGVEYDNAWEQYIAGEIDTFPRRSEFFLTEWLEAEENQGYYDGFWDGEDGEERGANRVEAPEDPEFEPFITMLNLDSGEAVWELNLVEEIDAPLGAHIGATDIAGTPYVAILAMSREETALVTVNRDSGEIVSTFEEDGARTFTAIDGDLFILHGEFDENEELEGIVSRHNPADLTEDPAWEVKVGNIFSLNGVGGEYIVARGWEEAEVLSAESGDRARWGRDIADSGVNYYPVAGQILRIEEDDDEYEIEAISLEDGRSIWDRAVTSEWFSTTGGVLLIGDETDDGFDRIQRIDPTNGEPMWENDIRDEFVGVGGLVQDRLLLANDRNRLVIFDAANGEEVDENRVGDVDRFFPGESIYYVVTDDELIAFSISDVEELWAMRIDDDHQVMALGDRFVLVDTDEKEIIGLE